MKLNIEINLDNSAYKYNPAEIKENLDTIAIRLSWGDESGIVFDSNGNKTGYWSIDDEQ